jgi:hypothetical protein
MLTTASSGTSRTCAIFATCSGCRSPSSMACIWPFSRRKLKNSFFCAAVVPIFTSDQLCRTYCWIAARIHHMAYVASRNPRSGSNRCTACMMPTLPSEISSPTGRPYPRYPMAIFATSRRCDVTSLCAASTSLWSRQRLESESSSSAESMGNLRISWRYREKLPAGSTLIRAEANGSLLLSAPAYPTQDGKRRNATD